MLVLEATPSSEGSIARIAQLLTGPSMGQRAGVLVAHRGEQLLVAVIGDTARAERIAKKLLADVGNSVRLAIGISASRSGDFAASRREATACAAFARRAGRQSAIVDHTSLGPLQFMLDATGTENVAALVVRRLSKLDDYDREHDSALLDTLRVYLEENGHHRSIAARCHVHPSTVKYRLARISEILECSFSDMSVRFELSLAIQLLDLFRLVGTDLLAPLPAGDADQTAGSPQI
jgi:DNA-binding PucR family transcriptional regulator